MKNANLQNDSGGGPSWASRNNSSGFGGFSDLSGIEAKTAQPPNLMEQNPPVAMGDIPQETPFKLPVGEMRQLPDIPIQAQPQAQDSAPLWQSPAMKALLAPAQNVPQSNFGLREDGTAKQNGFLGVLNRPDGSVSSELSIGVNMDGKEVSIPSMVPTLSSQELQYLLNGGSPTASIIQKAVEHAKGRMAQGKSPFADNSESPPVYPSLNQSQPTPQQSPQIPPQSANDNKTATVWRTATATAYGPNEGDGFGSQTAFKGPDGKSVAVEGQTVAVDGKSIPFNRWIEVQHPDGTTQRMFTHDTGSAVKAGTASKARGTGNPVIDFYTNSPNLSQANAKIGNSVKFRLLNDSDINS